MPHVVIFVDVRSREGYERPITDHFKSGKVLVATKVLDTRLYHNFIMYTEAGSRHVQGDFMNAEPTRV